ncbi:MAG TPA: MBL fold metallo-hydrolase [Acidimicrobiia bacterium]|nr:MBL fold metallo-hydrolase [Acidimicrobiia bacterium]
MIDGLAMRASVRVLQEGSGSPNVRSTVTLVRDAAHVIVIDPGMAPSQAAILAPLEREGLATADVTDVVISHHHPDHTVNVGLFGEARVHDHWAIYHHDSWTSRPAEGFLVSPSVMLWETPGHTAQDITTLVGTSDGVVAATHLWWRATGPSDDPFATDPASLHSGRGRVLAVAALVIPGHGPPFAPDGDTPR